MKFLLKQLSYSYIGTILCLFLISSHVFAAISNNPVADSQIWVQLTDQPITKNGKLYEVLTPGTVDNQQNAPVYIAECVDTVNDRVCTTGTVEGDSVLYQSDENLIKLQTLYGYTYQGMTDTNGKSIQNPVTTDANGNIPIIYLFSQENASTVRKFYTVNLIKGNIDISILPNLEKIHTGYSGGQQQGAFEVKVPTPVPTQKVEVGTAAPSHPGCGPHGGGGPGEMESGGVWDPVLGECVDPYGRVFDAVSLEPIQNAKVSLRVQRKDGIFTFMSPKETINAVINPWTTKEDGKYVFLTGSGIYQLQVDLPNYIFPFTSSELNPNYTKAYSELYYGSGFTDKNIVEKETIEHRDIPVIPRGEPYHAPVKLLAYMSELNKQKDQYMVTGRVSHPLTIIEVLGKKIDTSEVTRTLSKITADKWGFFNTMVETNNLQPNETVGMVKMTKVDLTQSTLAVIPQKKSFLSILADLFTIFPRSSSFAEKEKPTATPFTLALLNPLLNYLEGYAYDTNGKLISNAEVRIYLTGSKRPYFETKADEKGHYVITSQYLPQFNYSIQYITPEGKNYTITQTMFLEQNVKTFLTKNINVNKYMTSLAPFNVSAQERTHFSQEANNNIPSVNNSKTIVSVKNNSTMYIFIVIFLFILIGGTGIAYYLRKKRNSSQSS